MLLVGFANLNCPALKGGSRVAASQYVKGGRKAAKIVKGLVPGMGVKFKDMLMPIAANRSEVVCQRYRGDQRSEDSKGSFRLSLP